MQRRSFPSLFDVDLGLADVVLAVAVVDEGNAGDLLAPFSEKPLKINENGTHRLAIDFTLENTS